jgi:hypothetical protein
MGRVMFMWKHIKIEMLLCENSKILYLTVLNSGRRGSPLQPGQAIKPSLLWTWCSLSTLQLVSLM